MDTELIERLAERIDALIAERNQLRQEVERLQAEAGSHSLSLEQELKDARAEAEAARADLQLAREEVQERESRIQSATSRVQGLLDRLRES